MSETTKLYAGQRVRITRDPPQLYTAIYSAVGMEGVVTDRHEPDHKGLVAVRLSSGVEMWLTPEHFEPITSIPLEEQIEAVWQAQDAPETESAEYRRAMTGLRPDSALWKRNKLRAEAADRQRLALLAAHDTLRELAAREAAS